MRGTVTHLSPDPGIRVISEDPLGFAKKLFECLDKCLVFFGMCLIKMNLKGNTRWVNRDQVTSATVKIGLWSVNRETREKEVIRFFGLRTRFLKSECE